MLLYNPDHSKGTLQALFILFCFSPFSSAAWVVSLILKNDEFTTDNPQVGVTSNLSTLRFLVRTGMLARKVSPGIHRWEGRNTGSEFSI